MSFSSCAPRIARVILLRPSPDSVLCERILVPLRTPFPSRPHLPHSSPDSPASSSHRTLSPLLLVHHSCPVVFTDIYPVHPILLALPSHASLNTRPLPSHNSLTFFSLSPHACPPVFNRIPSTLISLRHSRLSVSFASLLISFPTLATISVVLREYGQGQSCLVDGRVMGVIEFEVEMGEFQRERDAVGV